MNTFLEFYMALLKFINFKLFSDIGVKNFAELASKDIDAKDIKAL